jgi:hypothetical protein
MSILSRGVVGNVLGESGRHSPTSELLSISLQSSRYKILRYQVHRPKAAIQVRNMTRQIYLGVGGNSVDRKMSEGFRSVQTCQRCRRFNGRESATCVTSLIPSTWDVLL